MSQARLETSVGILVCLGLASLLFLAFKVSGLSHIFPSDQYKVKAVFQTIGNLKPHAAVRIGGVRVGEVREIALQEDLTPAVTLSIESRFNRIVSNHATASILTEGLLGANYVGLTPGYVLEEEEKPTWLHEGSEIHDTQSAVVLENLISQLMFNQKKDKE